jgi:hypothetical protein
MYFCKVKKSIAIFFLFVFCFSLPGFSVELHYCKGKVTDISFFGEANCVCKDSHVEQSDKSTETVSCKKHCHKEAVSDESRQKLKKDKNCCKTEKLTFTSSKLKAISSSKLSQLVAVLAVVNPFLLSELSENAGTDFLLYEPPLLDQDLLVLNSVFII